MVKSFLKYLCLLLVVLLLIWVAFGVYVMTKTTTQGGITWQSCYRPAYLSWFRLPPPLTLQCATVRVPVDYQKPEGKSFSLPLTRLPSKSDNPIGELLMLNGGPGGHSLDLAVLMMDDEYAQKVQDNFHIIGYAPRGVAPSSPAIDCGGVDEDEDAKAYMQACIKHTGTDILPFISSKEVVRDLDSVRSQLGVETWSMVGYSYGTKLVAKYAERYPAHLRAGVADGVVDTSEDLFTILTNQYKGAQVVFDKFVETHHNTCQHDCLFDKNQASSRAFIELLASISAKKLTDKNGKLIDSEGILTIFNENLNDSGYWSDMVNMLTELKAGKTDEYNVQLTISEFGEEGFSEDALVMVNCADSAVKMDKDRYIKEAKRIDAEARYDDIKPKSDEEYLDACYHWQWRASDDLTENLINEQTPNLLFIAQKYDLATPLANAVTMAKRFDDTLIYTPHHGHTVSLSGMNACVDEYVLKYLLDPKTRFDDKVILCQ